MRSAGYLYFFMKSECSTTSFLSLQPIFKRQKPLNRPSWLSIYAKPGGFAGLSRDFLGSPWIPYYGAPGSYWSIFSVINCRPFIHSKRRRKIHNSEEFCVLCNDCSRLESHCELLLCRSFELHSWFPPPASMPEMAHCGKSMDFVR